MRLLPFGVVLLAVSALLAFRTPSVPAGFDEAKALEPAASFVAGKRAHVYCALSHALWSAAAERNGTPNAEALTRVGSDASALEPFVCATLLTQLEGRAVDVHDFAIALRALVHESEHQRGVAIEGLAECAAMHELPAVATRFFGIARGWELQALMAEAWSVHRAAPLYYQTGC